jgi:hypothetical protein
MARESTDAYEDGKSKAMQARKGKGNGNEEGAAEASRSFSKKHQNY